MKYEEFLEKVMDLTEVNTFTVLDKRDLIKLLAIIKKLKIQRYRMLAEKYAGFPNQAMNEYTILDKELDEIVGMG